MGQSLVQGSLIDYVCVFVITINNNPVYLQWLGRKGLEEEKKKSISNLYVLFNKKT